MCTGVACTSQVTVQFKMSITFQDMRNTLQHLRTLCVDRIDASIWLQGALMRAGFSFQRVHYGREAMTDIVLGAMQDTGWYGAPFAVILTGDRLTPIAVEHKVHEVYTCVSMVQRFHPE